MAKKITVYTTEPCSFCNRAKELLKKRGLEFEEVSLTKDPDGRTELAQKTGMMSFPQILIGNEVLGGYREALEADMSGRLEELAEAA